MFLWMVSGGAGHGDYFLARMIYPVPMLVSQQLGNFRVGLAIATIQFPMIGTIFGLLSTLGIRPLLSSFCGLVIFQAWCFTLVR